MTPKSSKNKDNLLTCIDILMGNSIPRRNFYILSGSDPYSFNKIIEKLKEIFLSDDPSGFNFNKFNADANTKAYSFLNVCEEYPFGARYKMIVVDNCQKLPTEEGNKIKKYLKSPALTSILVLIHRIEEGRVKTSGKFNPSVSLKIALAQYGLKITCNLVYSQVRNWIRKSFAKEKKKISSGAVEILIGNVGLDLWELHSEILKLCLFTDKKENITESDVKELTANRPQSKLYNLNEQIGAKKIANSLLILDDLYKEKVVLPQVLATLLNFFTFLYKVRSLYDKGKTSDEIAKTLCKHPYYIKKTLGQALNFSIESFDKIFDLLSRADAGMKSGLDQRWVAELLLIQLCRLKK